MSVWRKKKWWERIDDGNCFQNEEQSTVDETANDRADIIGNPEEATAEARGLVSKTFLDATLAGESGDVGHCRGGGVRGWQELAQSSSQTHKIAKAAAIGGEPGRELLLLLADGVVVLRALQSVDADCASESARAAAIGANCVVWLWQFYRRHFLPRRGRAVSYRVLGTGPHGLQQQETRRPLHQVQVLRYGFVSVNATRLAPGEPRHQPHAQIPALPQDLPGVQLLLHGRVAHRLPQSLAGTQFNSHPADPRALVRLFLLPSERGRGLPGRLGLSVQTRRVLHTHEKISGLALLVHPHTHHHRRLAHSGNQRWVSTQTSPTPQ